MAVLEAFVYDPLINWRLLQPKSPDDASDNAAAKPSRERTTSHKGDSADEGMRDSLAQATMLTSNQQTF